MEDGGLDTDGPTEPLCSDLEWELVGLGTGGGAPHPDMPGLYRCHSLPSRPATPIEAFVRTSFAGGSPADKGPSKSCSNGAWEVRSTILAFYTIEWGRGLP